MYFWFRAMLIRATSVWSPVSPDPIQIQAPVMPAARLILLFHGVGGTAKSMVPLGKSLAGAFPDSAVFSVPAPDPCDTSTGYQWFSISGVNEKNRQLRIAAAMNHFLKSVQGLQRLTGTSALQTVLIGFSQGGMMALAASQTVEPLASCIVSIAGRLALRPNHPSLPTSFHLIHGNADPVISVDRARDAYEILARIGARVTLDIIPGLGHQIDQRVADRLVERLAERATDPPP